jgi:hypothetical protein
LFFFFVILCRDQEWIKNGLGVHHIQDQVKMIL